MTTAASDPQIVPRRSASMPALRAADQGVADALESVLSDNTKRVYADPVEASFDEWCGDGGPAFPARRSPSPWPATWPSVPAIRRQPSPPCAWRPSAIAKAHELAGHESPGRDRGVREALKGWGRRSGESPSVRPAALTADVLAVIRLTTPKPRARGRGLETAEQAAQRGRFDVALVAVLSDAGLETFRGGGTHLGRRCSAGTTAAGRITVIRSKTDAEAARAPWWPSPPPLCRPWT